MFIQVTGVHSSGCTMKYVSLPSLSNPKNTLLVFSSEESDSFISASVRSDDCKDAGLTLHCIGESLFLRMSKVILVTPMEVLDICCIG